MTPEKKFRSAAAMLLEASSFVPLIWWQEGDKQIWRDHQGGWTYYDKPINGDIRVHLERMYQLAVWLEKHAPLEPQGGH